MLPNTILTTQLRNDGTHKSICFCVTCRERKMNTLAANLTFEQVHRLFFQVQASLEDAAAENLLQTTLERIAAGESFRKLCLSRRYNPHGYTSFGVWLNRHTNRTEQERKKICMQMTEVKMINAHWEEIVTNLTDRRMTHVDARRFTINKFYRAININFCLNQQRLNGPQTTPVEIIQEYDEQKFQDIMALVCSSGILDDVSYCPDQAKLIVKRFRKEINNLCKEMQVQ